MVFGIYTVYGKYFESIYSISIVHICSDVVFMYEGGKIQGHKAALAAYSEFLVQRFSEYPAGEIVSIDMTDFTVDIITCVLNFVYTTEVELTDKSVGPVMKCADELGICALSHMCIEVTEC